MAENYGARFNSCAFFDLFAEVVSDSTESYVSEFVHAFGKEHFGAAFWFCSLSDDYDTVVFSSFLSFLDVFADFFYVEGFFRNQYDVCSSGESCF